MKDLNFKSGTRFELNNNSKPGIPVRFKSEFFYGDSKRIKTVKLNKTLLNKYITFLLTIDVDILIRVLKTVKKIKKYNQKELQLSWVKNIYKGNHPFELVDLLNSCAVSIHEEITDIEDKVLLKSMKKIFNKNDEVGQMKLIKNYKKIFCGILVCSYFNYIN